ncbi:MAG: DUF167 domain-containing protein [bacterium]
MKTIITIDIKVFPASGKQLCTADKAGRIKCYVKSPPEKGKANQELVKFLSKKLNLPQESVYIISGLTSRNKRVRIESANKLDTILAQLGVEIQMKI